VVNGKGYTVLRNGSEEPGPATEAQPEAPLAEAPRPSKKAAPGQSENAGHVAVRAPIPGKILSIAVEVGDQVRYSDALCALEAMKMESVIRAPVNGKVEEVRVKSGDSVQYDDVLLVLGGLSE